MYVSRAMKLAQAVATAVAAAPATPPFSSAVQVRPRYAVAELTGEKITVMPRTLAREPLDRESSVWRVTVDVAIQRLLSSEALAEIDGLMRRLELLGQWLQGRDLPTVDAVCDPDGDDPMLLLHTEHYDQHLVYTGVISRTYFMAVGDELEQEVPG